MGKSRGRKNDFRETYFYASKFISSGTISMCDPEINLISNSVVFWMWCRTMIMYGYHCHLGDMIYLTDWRGTKYAPIHRACEGGHLDVVKILLEHDDTLLSQVRWTNYQMLRKLSSSLMESSETTVLHPFKSGRHCFTLKQRLSIAFGVRQRKFRAGGVYTFHSSRQNTAHQISSRENVWLPMASRLG